MSLTRRLIAVVLGVATATTLALAGPAHARSASVADAIGDASSRYLDIIRLTVDNGGRRLTARVDLTRFDPELTAGAFVLVRGANPRTRRDLYVIGWSRLQEEQTGRGWLFAKRTPGGLEEQVCAGVRISTTTRQLAVTVPQRCLGRTAGTLRVSALTERRDGRDADEAGPRRVRRG